MSFIVSHTHFVSLKILLLLEGRIHPHRREDERKVTAASNNFKEDWAVVLTT